MLVSSHFPTTAVCEGAVTLFDLKMADVISREPLLNMAPPFTPVFPEKVGLDIRVFLPDRYLVDVIFKIALSAL